MEVIKKQKVIILFYGYFNWAYFFYNIMNLFCCKKITNDNKIRTFITKKYDKKTIQAILIFITTYFYLN